MRSAGRVEVRQGTRQVFRQMQIQRAAQGNVDLLHAQADAQQRQLALQEQPHQTTVARVAAFGHELEARGASANLGGAGPGRDRPTGRSRRVDRGTDRDPPSLTERRQHDRHAAGRYDGVKVADVEAYLTRRSLDWS